MPPSNKLLEIIGIQTDVARLGFDLGGVMELVTHRTLGLVGADGAAIELAEGDDMVYRAATGIAKSYLGLHLKRTDSLSGLCVAQGKVLTCDDAATDPRVNQEACSRIGLRSMLVVPLSHAGVTVGVLKAMSSHVAHFNEVAVELLRLMSDVVGAAMYFAARYAAEDLFHRATHDSLTDLPNRSLFMDRLHSALAQSVRDDTPFAVMMLDMNGLKPINDQLGHRVGDAALIEFARRLKTCTRQSDTAARLGGDEYAVLLRPITQVGGVDASVTRFRKILNGPHDFEGTTLNLSGSMGVACFPQDGREADALIDAADQRMYEHKRVTKSAPSGDADPAR